MRRREFLGTLSASLLAGSLMSCAGEDSLTGPVLNLLQDSEDSVRRAVLTALPRLAGHFHEVPADFERRFV